MAKFTWQDGTLVSKAKVEIGGTIYEVDPEEYSGATPLSASNLNAMQDGIYEDIGNVNDLDTESKDLVEASNEINDKMNYSSTETIVGKWIDNRPIYRKVIYFGILPNNGSKEVNPNISNLDYVISMNGVAKINGSSLSHFPLPYIVTAGIQYTIDLAITADGTIRIRTLDDRTNYTAYITLEYTKTTD